MSQRASGEPQEFTALRLSTQFRRLQDLCLAPPVLFEDLIRHVTSRTHALLILLLSLPFLLPLPLPGLSTPFGFLIALASGRMLFRLPPWVPQRLLHKPAPHALLGSVFARAEKLMIRFESYIKPRGVSFVQNRTIHALACLIMFANGLLLALPLPPGTNFPPAFPCVILSIALLEDDGVFMVAGLTFGSLVLAVFTLIPLLGFEAVKAALAL